MVDSGTYTPEAIARRMQIAQQLLDFSKEKPVHHWAQGLDELAKGAVGGAMFGQAEESERRSRYDSSNAMLQALGLPGQAPYVPQYRGPIDRVASLFGGGSAPASAAPAEPPPAPPMGAAAPQPVSAAAPVSRPAPPSPSLPVSAAAIDDPSSDYNRSLLAPPPAGRAGVAAALSRPEVPSTDKVWGDREAEAAGLYEPRPGSLSRFPSTPSPSALPPSVAAPTDATPPSAMGNIPEAKRRQIGAMLLDPATRQMGLETLKAAINKEGDFVPLTDPRQRTAAGIGPEDKTPYQIDRQTGKISAVNTAPITNVALNTALKGQEKAAEMAVTEMQGAQSAGRDAAKRSQIWDQMEQASRGFTPGATADIKLEAKRLLKDLGFQTEGVPDAEVFKQLQQQIAVHAQPKGQGSVSNTERELFAKAIPNITMSPEALSRSIQISRGLDEFDRKVAKIYRDSARSNSGVPNSVEVNDKIDALGSPLSLKDQRWLSSAGQGGAAPAASAPTSQPDRAAIEAEMKRRGLKP
jgi:hypothetical protein